MDLAAKYPQVRTFMVALKMDVIERTDLIQVELPWSVPTASKSRIYLFRELLKDLFFFWAIEL